MQQAFPVPALLRLRPPEPPTSSAPAPPPSAGRIHRKSPITGREGHGHLPSSPATPLPPSNRATASSSALLPPAPPPTGRAHCRSRPSATTQAIPKLTASSPLPRTRADQHGSSQVSPSSSPHPHQAAGHARILFSGHPHDRAQSPHRPWRFFLLHPQARARHRALFTPLPASFTPQPPLPLLPSSLPSLPCLFAIAGREDCRSPIPCTGLSSLPRGHLPLLPSSCKPRPDLGRPSNQEPIQPSKRSDGQYH